MDRRTFVAGAASLAVLGKAGAVSPLPSTSHNVYYVKNRPITNDLNLSIGALPVNFTGNPATAIAVNGGVPAPLLRWRQGDTVTLRVANRLAVDTSIHWHGILLPAHMDGVPSLSFHGIGPGKTYVYRFTLKQAGTYWYHAHSSLQVVANALRLRAVHVDAGHAAPHNAKTRLAPLPGDG